MPHTDHTYVPILYFLLLVLHDTFLWPLPLQTDDWVFQIAFFIFDNYRLSIDIY